MIVANGVSECFVLGSVLKALCRLYFSTSLEEVSSLFLLYRESQGLESSGFPRATGGEYCRSEADA